jgi:hypothetical protein
MINSLLSGVAQAKGTFNAENIDASKSLQVEMKAKQLPGESQNPSPLKNLRIVQQPQLVPITIRPASTSSSGTTPNAVPTTAPTSVTAYQGDIAYYGVQVLCGGNTSCLQSAFTITLLNQPPGSTYSITPNPVFGEQPFTVSVATASVPPGVYSFSLNGSSLAGSTAFVPFTLIVLAPPSGTITPPSGSSSSATASPGGNATYNLKLSIPSNYPGNLTMGVDPAGSSPQLGGTSYAFTPQTVNFNASLTTLVATIATTTPPGTFNIKVTATPTPGSPGVNIPPFIGTVVVSGSPVVTPPTITAIPSSLTLEAGQSNVSTIITLQRNGLVGTVNLQVLSVNNATPGIGYQVVPTAVPDLYNLNLATGYQSTTLPNTPIQLVIGSNNPAQGIPNIVFPLTVTAAPTVIRSFPTPPTIASLSSTVLSSLSSLVIRGSGLNTTGKITFNGIQATEYYSSSNNEITVKVPPGVAPGSVTLVVTATGGITTTTIFLKRGSTDVDGDGRDDAVAVNSNASGNPGVFVRLSNGTSFAPATNWTGISYKGDKGNFFADVTGDGKADAIVSNSTATGAPGIIVRRSNGTSFSGNENWTPGDIFYGNLGTYFADVNGDGKADAIGVNSAATGSPGVFVRLSNGTSFAPAINWTGGAEYVGDVGTYFADVTGDGKADAVVVNSNATAFPGISVRTSNGTDYARPSTNWTGNTEFKGTYGTYFADVDGDGKADAVASTSTGLQVRRSTGTSFGPVENWTTGGAYLGDLGSYFADVTGNGTADAMVNNSPGSFTGITVRRSTGAIFKATNEFWTVQPFSGDLGTFVGVPTSPTVGAVSATSAPVGSTIVITGGSLKTTTSVTFNGVQASYIINSDQQITVTVPNRATSGPIKIVTAGGVTTVGNFSVLAVNSFSPTSGYANTSVTITGSGFSGAQPLNSMV